MSDYNRPHGWTNFWLAWINAGLWATVMIISKQLSRIADALEALK